MHVKHQETRTQLYRQTWKIFLNTKVLSTLGDINTSYTANVLSAEIADECLQTKSKDNLQ